MNQSEHADEQTDENEEQRRSKKLPRWLLIAICLAAGLLVSIVVLGLVILGLITASRFLSKDTDPVQFITINSLSVLIFGAVVVQAGIYLIQWLAMRDGLRQGREALQITERAYVGVHSIEQQPNPHERDMVLKIENNGRLPASEVIVRINVILLTRDGNPPVSGEWTNDFQRTNLFKGNLKLEIPIPIAKSFDVFQLDRVFAGQARLITQISIEYRDGFRNTKRRRSDYAFRFQEGKWLSWPVWTVETIEERYAEEQLRYP